MSCKEICKYYVGKSNPDLLISNFKQSGVEVDQSFKI